MVEKRLVGKQSRETTDSFQLAISWEDEYANSQSRRIPRFCFLVHTDQNRFV